MAIDMIILHDNGYVEQVDANGVGRPADMEQYLEIVKGAMEGLVSKEKKRLSFGEWSDPAIRITNYEDERNFTVVTDKCKGTILISEIMKVPRVFTWPMMYWTFTNDKLYVQVSDGKDIYDSPFPNDSHGAVCMSTTVPIGGYGSVEHKFRCVRNAYMNLPFTEFRGKTFVDVHGTVLTAKEFWEMCVKHGQLVWSFMIKLTMPF